MDQTSLSLHTDKPVTLTYQCRDIGYGTETDTVEGQFTGEVDTQGKWTFVSNAGDVMYLFPDEVVGVELMDTRTEVRR